MKQIKSSFRDSSAARIPRQVSFVDIKKSTRRSLFQSAENLASWDDAARKTDSNVLEQHRDELDAQYSPRQHRFAFKKAINPFKKPPLNAKLRQD